jgi:hypothetical protein
MEGRLTTEELLKAVLSLRSVLKLCKEDTSLLRSGLRVEATSTTSIVALRVVGADGKGTQCAWV